MNLNDFMAGAICRVMQTAGRFYLESRKGRAFLAQSVQGMKKSAALRAQNEAQGTHVPAFLIASVASQCNLHCAGCYARAGGACDSAANQNLNGSEWTRIFKEATELGVSFVLLAGGEPLMRRDVMQAAAAQPQLVFPVFTNGTMIDADYLTLFDDHRNLIPVISIEGGQAETDARRGAGVHAKIETAMAAFEQRGILFGASITVTNENMATVLDPQFLAGLRRRGCGLVVLVEYVPAVPGTDGLTLNPAQLEQLNQSAIALKSQFRDMVILAFPGDEEKMGGCLASGRGFFHINPAGGAEPCPFSPYAKYSLKSTSMSEVLRSGYFEKLRSLAAEAGPHTGGCVLFQREKEVRALLAAR